MNRSRGLRIAPGVEIAEDELVIEAVRARGAGGQNVNKVSSAAHLRFDVRASGLPEACKARLLALADQRLTGEGVLVIKAQEYRTLERNRRAALERLRRLVQEALKVERKRVPTAPSRRARRERLENKSRRGRMKMLRRPVRGDET